MNLGLQGKIAIVTGASGGMGRNIARMLAEEGARPVLFARNAEKLEALAAELRDEFAVDPVAVAGDMLVPEDVARLGEAAQAVGGPDVLILVTGRPPWPIHPTLQETDRLRWQQACDAQLFSVISVAGAIVPQMVEQGWGRVVAITSASAKQPMPNKTLSTTFRAAVTAYLKGLAGEIASTGVTVNTVAPVYIETPHRSGAQAYTPEQEKARASDCPMGRMGTQEELCGVVGFLASRQAGFVTGSTVTVDGGLVGSLF